MTKDYYFLPLSELDFWIQIAIVAKLKKVQKDCRCIMIKTDYPRISGKFADEISQFFDDELVLPYTGYSLPSIRHFKTIFAINNELKRADIKPESRIIACGWWDLLHLLIGLKTRKRYHCKLISIKPLPHFQNNIEIDIRRTFLSNISSLLFCRKLVKWYRESNTKGSIDIKMKPFTDVTVFLEHKGPYNYKKTIHSAPFPLLNPKSHGIAAATEITENSILVLVDSALTNPEYGGTSKYWLNMNLLIKAIKKRFPNFPVVVKLHPRNNKSDCKNISIEGIGIIDNSISSEQLYVHSSDKIAAVFSSFSTGLLTATFFQIPSFHCSHLLRLDPNFIASLSEYLALANNLSEIDSWEALNEIVLQSVTERVPQTDKYEQAAWDEIIKIIQ